MYISSVNIYCYRFFQVLKTSTLLMISIVKIMCIHVIEKVSLKTKCIQV